MKAVKDRPNKEAEAIRELAAKIMGWDREDVDTFSFQMLKEMLRGKDHPDVERCIKAIDWGLDQTNPHPLWLGEPSRDPRAWEGDPSTCRRNHPDPLEKYRR